MFMPVHRKFSWDLTSFDKENKAFFLEHFLWLRESAESKQTNLEIRKLCGLQKILKFLF